MNQVDAQVFQPQEGIGALLRQTRQASGASVADIAQRLRMSVHVIEALEAENWDRLGAPVFVRGQLRSYARLLGLPVEQVMQMPQIAPVSAPELKPRTYTLPMQRFAEHAARRAVYIVLTAAILVPVWLATRPHIVQQQAADDTAPLDAPAPDQGRPVAVDGPAARPRRETMIASIAPISSRSATLATAAPPTLSLKFNADSWVQVIGVDGDVIESGLVAAGERRQYDAGTVGRMVLGNAGAVELRHGGQLQDLSPFLRANVARFTVSSSGVPTAPTP